MVMNSLVLLILAAIIVLVLLVVVGIVAAVLIARSRGSANAAPPAGGTPLDVLKLRYARGEITREQFQAMRTDLEAR